MLVSGLELNHGAQLAVDITVRSAVTARGRARPNASTVDGAVLVEACQDKEAKYAELSPSSPFPSPLVELFKEKPVESSADPDQL